ncbi:MAG: CASTOR/POLLUX-related putative ion channel [Candidatus Neomarinimicrobiota bacterium]
MSKNNNYPFKMRLRYKIDNFMSKGSSSIFLALLALFMVGFLIMVFIRGIANAIMPDETLGSWFEIPWRVYVAVMEGSAAETDGDSNWMAKLTSILGVLVGLILFSSMVAFITSVFEAKLDELRRGRSLVLENDHTLILGFGDRILEVIRELIEANESEPDASIVILAEKDKEEMDNIIRDNISDFATTRIITRSGVVTNINNLKKVMAENAKSVIIMNSAANWRSEQEKNLADALVLKSIMSMMAVCENDSHPPIVCEIHSDRDRELAEQISNGIVKALNEVSVLSRMIAQLALSRNGLSVVYGDMVGFDGNEFYFYQPDDGWGGELTFGDSQNRFNSSTPMGIHNSKGEIILNPHKEMLINEDDELIVFAEDDSTIFYFNKPVFEPKLNTIPKTIVKPRSQRVALLNWTTKTPIILKRLCSYLPENSELYAYVSNKIPEMDVLLVDLKKDYPGIKISIIELDLNDLEILDQIEPQDFDSILILSPGGTTIEEMDAYVISLLIRIRQILITKAKNEPENEKLAIWPKLITEVMDSENIDIILNSGVEDFMVSNQFVSQIMAQVSEEPLALDVYDDLFQSEGSELYIKPASYYFDFSDKQSITLPYGECVQAAKLRDEVILGIQIKSAQKKKDKMFGIALIPDKNEEITLTSEDGLIALANDET